LLSSLNLATVLTMQTDDPRTVYGVYEVPTYMSEARRVDSTWDSERPAIERARQRSVQVHGRVFVLRWTLNSSGGQAVAAFVDGEPAPATATTQGAARGAARITRL